RRHPDRGGLVKRSPQNRSKVGSLLPGHLAGADPEREVVDEDRRGRRPWPAEWRAWPVRIEDGVAFQTRLDRGQPARLEHELVAVRREDRLAVQIRQRHGPLAAAQEHEFVLSSIRDQGPGQLDRHRDHADTLGPPARRHVDREPHRKTLEEDENPARAASGPGVIWPYS